MQTCAASFKVHQSFFSQQKLLKSKQLSSSLKTNDKKENIKMISNHIVHSSSKRSRKKYTPFFLFLPLLYRIHKRIYLFFYEHKVIFLEFIVRWSFHIDHKLLFCFSKVKKRSQNFLPLLFCNMPVLVVRRFNVTLIKRLYNSYTEITTSRHARRTFLNM